MYHSASQNLYPSGMFTDIASFSATDQTTDIHFCTGFCKRKKRRTKTNAGIFPEHFFYKIIKGLFKVGKRDLIVYIKAFYLMKKTMSSGRNRFISEYTPRTNNTNWKLPLFHHTNLYGRSMGTQHLVRIPAQKESILHVPGRMVGRKIE